MSDKEYIARLEEALTDLLDSGNFEARNIVAQTGVSYDRALEIEELFYEIQHKNEKSLDKR